MILRKLQKIRLIFKINYWRNKRRYRIKLWNMQKRSRNCNQRSNETLRINILTRWELRRKKLLKERLINRRLKTSNLMTWKRIWKRKSLKYMIWRNSCRIMRMWSKNWGRNWSILKDLSLRLLSKMRHRLKIKI